MRIQLPAEKKFRAHIEVVLRGTRRKIRPRDVRPLTSHVLTYPANLQQAIGHGDYRETNQELTEKPSALSTHRAAVIIGQTG